MARPRSRAGSAARGVLLAGLLVLLAGCAQGSGTAGTGAGTGAASTGAGPVADSASGSATRDGQPSSPRGGATASAGSTVTPGRTPSAGPSSRPAAPPTAKTWSDASATSCGVNKGEGGRDMEFWTVRNPSGGTFWGCDLTVTALAHYYAARPNAGSGSAPIVVDGFRCNHIPATGDWLQVTCVRDGDIIFSSWLP